MRKIREVLRLKAAGHSDRAIAASVGAARSTVQECLRRARAAGLAWPLPEDQNDAVLSARLYPRAAPPASAAATPARMPDWAEVARELARKHVTRRQLWREYRERCPDGLSYTSFCVGYRQWRNTTGAPATMVQDHVPGEHLFVDYSGDPAYWTDRKTGKRIAAQLFIAVWGFSHKLFAVATPHQKTEDWIQAHVAALTAFGCVPAALVPDNASAVVRRVCRYDPDLNPTYYELAGHYGTAIVPARSRKPRDKAKVEGAVLIAQRRILGALRDATFFSLAELNAAITAIVAQINADPFQKREGSRDSVFDQHERAAARPLPTQPFQYGSWHRCVVHPDHHVEVGRARYSVPYAYIGQTVEVRLGARVVQVFKDGALIAAHARGARHQRLTVDAHRPPAHQAYLALDMAGLLEQARRIGPSTAAVLARQRQLKQHRQQQLRSAQGILRLAADFSPQALERAATAALRLQVCSYRAVRDLIEQPPAAAHDPEPTSTVHENVRGARYFH